MIRGANRYRARGDRIDDLVARVVDVFMHGVSTPAGQRVVAADGLRRRR